MAAVYPGQGQQPVVVHLHVHMHNKDASLTPDAASPYVQEPTVAPAPPQPPLRARPLPRLIYSRTPPHEPRPVYTTQTPRLMHKEQTIFNNGDANDFSRETRSVAPATNPSFRYFNKGTVFSPDEAGTVRQHTGARDAASTVRQHTGARDTASTVRQHTGVHFADRVATNSHTGTAENDVFVPRYSEKYVRNVQRQTTVTPGVAVPYSKSVSVKQTTSRNQVKSTIQPTFQNHTTYGNQVKSTIQPSFQNQNASRNQTASLNQNASRKQVASVNQTASLTQAASTRGAAGRCNYDTAPTVHDYRPVPLRKVFTDNTDAAPIGFDVPWQQQQQRPRFEYTRRPPTLAESGKSVSTPTLHSPEAAFEQAKSRRVYRDERTGKTYRVHSMLPITEERSKDDSGVFLRRYECCQRDMGDGYRTVGRGSSSSSRNNRLSMPMSMASLRAQNPSPMYDNLLKETEEAEQLSSMLQSTEMR